ncbi:DUF2076 family protein [Undibacterium sp. Jales W-56]|uniref:DUF2076 domain-containing protein n=1 Tax=Undibacterium sp. Jales W-56 TaxID=2897325 RepID=UPI0021CEB690|nr:DUF2076 family protein [Undibacterium sp. Jales W-56]MCU6434162.1 DUF2076 family protein [Undibacterium sp. Jales W-56]
MSPNEIQLLQTFLAQLVATQAQGKDAQAQAMIADAVSQQPDAAYLLVQRSLLLEQAVGNAQHQIRQLQSENAELKNSSASKPSVFLQPASNAWGNSASSPPLNTSSLTSTSVTGAALNTATTSANIPATATSPMPVSNTGFFGANTGNILGTVAATAAGVAAGAFLYQGIGNLLGASHHASVADGAASLNNADGGFIPNYFDGDQTHTEPEQTPALTDTTELASTDDTDNIVDDASSSDLDEA